MLLILKHLKPKDDDEHKANQTEGNLDSVLANEQPEVPSNQDDELAANPYEGPGFGIGWYSYHEAPEDVEQYFHDSAQATDYPKNDSPKSHELSPQRSLPRFSPASSPLPTDQPSNSHQNDEGPILASLPLPVPTLPLCDYAVDCLPKPVPAVAAQFVPIVPGAEEVSDGRL